MKSLTFPLTLYELFFVDLIFFCLDCCNILQNVLLLRNSGKHFQISIAELLAVNVETQKEMSGIE